MISVQKVSGAMWSDKDFDLGIVMAHAYGVAEKERQAAALAKLRSLRVELTPTGDTEYQKALNEADPSPPMWQLVSGISPRNELTLDPATRRAGIRRLMRVVERMFRADMQVPDEDGDGQLKLDDGTESYSRRSPIWDPLPEICMYLGISKAKLNVLSVHRTGLRATEVCDCIRIEKLRTTLRAKFRPLMREWADGVKEKGDATFAADVRNGAWRFLKWIRGGGRCETRKKFAYALGMTSRERLDRACLVREGETIEAIEVDVAMLVLKELAGVPEEARADTEGSHGAECDEVVRASETAAVGEENGDGLRESA